MVVSTWAERKGGVAVAASPFGGATGRLCRQMASGKWPPAYGHWQMADFRRQTGVGSILTCSHSGPFVASATICRRPFANRVGRLFRFLLLAESPRLQLHCKIFCPSLMRCSARRWTSRMRIQPPDLLRMSPHALDARILVQTIYLHALALRPGKAAFLRTCFFLKKSKLPPTSGDARRIAVANKAESAVLRSSSSESGIG